MSLSFTLDGGSVEIDPTAVVIAGFTGRDRDAVQHHLAELAELGVPTPDTVPSFYLTPGTSAVQQPRLSMVSAETSGEAEAVLVFDGDDAYLTLGSDHTDRAAEAIDIPLSKLACPKPLATEAWRLEEVAGHADDLTVRSWITTDGTETLYQQGTPSRTHGPRGSAGSHALRRSARAPGAVHRHVRRYRRYPGLPSGSGRCWRIRCGAARSRSTTGSTC